MSMLAADAPSGGAESRRTAPRPLSVDVPLDLRVWPDSRVAAFPIDRPCDVAVNVEIASAIVDIARNGAVEIDLRPKIENQIVVNRAIQDEVRSWTHHGG